MEIIAFGGPVRETHTLVGWCVYCTRMCVLCACAHAYNR